MSILNYLEHSYPLPEVPLKAGAKAPEFSVTLTDGREVPMKELIDKGPLMLNFIRGTWCMFCRSHMGSVNKWIEQTNKNVTVLVISDEDLEVVRDFKKKEQLTYLMGSDPSSSIISAFGLELSDAEYNRPAVFLIDKDQIIRMAHYEKRTPKVFKKVEEAL